MVFLVYICAAVEGSRGRTWAWVWGCWGCCRSPPSPARCRWGCTSPDCHRAHPGPPPPPGSAHGTRAPARSPPAPQTQHSHIPHTIGLSDTDSARLCIFLNETRLNMYINTAEIWCEFISIEKVEKHTTAGISITYWISFSCIFYMW